jgi:hypothetical protein
VGKSELWFIGDWCKWLGSNKRSSEAEYRRRRDEEERQCRAMVIAELGAGAKNPEATMHAMADEDPEVPPGCEAAGGLR